MTVHLYFVICLFQVIFPVYSRNSKVRIFCMHWMLIHNIYYQLAYPTLHLNIADNSFLFVLHILLLENLEMPDHHSYTRVSHIFQIICKIHGSGCLLDRIPYVHATLSSVIFNTLQKCLSKITAKMHCTKILNKLCSLRCSYT